MTYKEGIKHLRKKMLLTQKEFSNYFKVAFATVNRWEQGHSVPSIKAKRELQPYFKKYKIRVEE